MLSDQAARRTLASRQRGEGFGRGNSLAVRSGRQTNVSEPAARRGIRKGELTRCQIRPPSERQRAGSAARDLEVGTHKLPDQAGSQANVSEPAARRGIRKGELTRCQIRPPNER